MIITTEKQRATLIEAGRRLAAVLEACADKVAPGVSTEELDDLAEQLIRDGGDEPAFLGYTPEGAARPYPATLCVSINEEVVHGIPNEETKILKLGDIVGLDLGLVHGGIIVDAAVTVAVGQTDSASLALMRATEEALVRGIDAAQVGNHIGDISSAIEKAFKGTGFSVVKELGGHGVGDHVHEEPFVPNFGKEGEGEELVEGMVLALEPIASAGKAAVVIAPDGYTYRTKDGSRSAHFEHTILIEKDGPLVVTKA
ncbi:MAG TPA: type I methionyl aminopeptidase [Candidatus Paceibacterota bacterium]|nr:type I methionyl aminopeptidase [Candidatus Paceibacterota bacterium]